MKSDVSTEEAGRLMGTYEGRLLVGLLGVFAPLCGLGWLATAVSNQRIPGWEGAILRLFPCSTAPVLDRAIGVVALGGEIEVVVVFAVLGVLALRGLKRLRDALFLTVAVVGVVVLNLLVRAAVQRAQPAWAGSPVPTFGFGFPSSQAADSFAIALVASVLVWPTRWRWMVIMLGILYVVAVGLARMYLGVHYPSDILAGWALALACVTAASFVRRAPCI